MYRELKTSDESPLNSSRDDGIVVVERSGGSQDDVVRALRKEKPMTTSEYLRTPERVSPAQLAYGELVVRDAPSPRHQDAVKRYFLALHQHVESRHLGEIWLSPLDVILDAERALVVQPDLLFISKARAGILMDRVRGAPDMVLEVLSPYPRVGEIEERLGWYAYYGVRECWVVRLFERQLEVVAAGDGRIGRRARFGWDESIVSMVFPEFSTSPQAVLGYPYV
jgi:Uma2 family endonuclease